MTKLLATDLILAARDGDPSTIIGKLNGPDAKDRAYIQAMIHHCAVAGIDPFIALTQWLVETSNGESVRWNNDYNAAGIGIPADSTVQPFTIKDGDEAARIHAQALYSAVTGKLHDRIPLPDASVEWFTEIWLPKVNNRNYPGVTTVDDLNTRYTANGDVHATWAWDANYVTTLISRCSAFYPDLQEQSSFTVPIEHPQGGTSLELKQYAVCISQNNDGSLVTKNIWSPVPIIIDLIPRGQTNQRPEYARRSPAKWVQHETANEAQGADAAMHNRWLHGGASGATLSFHFATDDGVIYQMIPLDEVTWQAADGSGPGNFNGISNEMCVNSDGDMALARRNSEYLCGGVSFLMDIADGDEDRHYDFNWADPDRHYCPYYMMIQGYWPTFQANAIAIKRRYVDGSIDTDKPVPVPTPYTAPTVWPWMNPKNPGFGKDHTVNGTRFFFVPNNYTVIQQAERQAWAAKDSPPAGPPIAVGTRYGGYYVFRSNDDQQTYAPTKNGNRVLARKLLPRVQITKSGTVTVRASATDKPVMVRRQGKPVKAVSTQPETATP